MKKLPFLSKSLYLQHNATQLFIHSQILVIWFVEHTSNIIRNVFTAALFYILIHIGLLGHFKTFPKLIPTKVVSQQRRLVFTWNRLRYISSLRTFKNLLSFWCEHISNDKDVCICMYYKYKTYIEYILFQHRHKI